MPLRRGRAAASRVHGLYRAGDIDGFADATGHLDGLGVRGDDERVLIR